MKKNILIFLLIFTFLIPVIIQEEYQKSQLQHTISQYKLMLSLARMDSVVINCVQCNQRNVNT